MSGKLKIRVDPEKCQGHARCKSLAPELFDLDEFGNSHERGDGAVPAGLEDKAWLPRSHFPGPAVEVVEGGNPPPQNKTQARRTRHLSEQSGGIARCPIPSASCPNIPQ